MENINKKGVTFTAHILTAPMPAIRPNKDNKKGKIQHHGSDKRTSKRLLILSFIFCIPILQ